MRGTERRHHFLSGGIGGFGAMFLIFSSFNLNRGSYSDASMTSASSVLRHTKSQRGQ
jgi:hypothetical protein